MSELNVEDLLFVIYSENEGLSNNEGRFIDYAFTTKGLVDFTDVNYDDFLTLSVVDEKIGPIDTHEELVKFSYYLSESVNAKGVCLCNTEATNQSFLEAKNIQNLHTSLKEAGDILENPEKKSKGFFAWM